MWIFFPFRSLLSHQITTINAAGNIVNGILMHPGFQCLLTLKVPFYKIKHKFALIFVKPEKLRSRYLCLHKFWGFLISKLIYIFYLRLYLDLTSLSVTKSLKKVSKCYMKPNQVQFYLTIKGPRGRSCKQTCEVIVYSTTTMTNHKLAIQPPNQK